MKNSVDKVLYDLRHLQLTPKKNPELLLKDIERLLQVPRLDSGTINQLIRGLKKFHLAYKDSPQALVLTGQLYQKLGDNDQTLDFYNSARKESPYFWDSYIFPATLLIQSGRYQEAKVVLNDLLFVSSNLGDKARGVKNQTFKMLNQIDDKLDQQKAKVAEINANLLARQKEEAAIREIEAKIALEQKPKNDLPEVKLPEMGLLPKIFSSMFGFYSRPPVVVPVPAPRHENDDTFRHSL